ncbi:phospholipase D/competence protein ComEA helix-hairpin-helix domain protein [Candidatus Thiomargarita nelsonii]|uniref:Phospholipase D/competence protein ComEA helix-hairpin-helix domain protein n=1 Tax=Candidatus Thiomargarita nelsonii TaxID=1003181 RepID=A0A176S376_9GAMM|nr:phospholipase D/competence protein ComEA helix-hairpin-helix domain protein [Candidatus Thiomargarita nelsonii]
MVQYLNQCQTDKGKLAQQLKQLRTQLASQESNTTIAINEIAWMGTTTHYNDEWIELYNYGNSPINLEGWKLIVYKNEGGWKKWETPLSGQIKGGQFLILRKVDNQKRVSLKRWNGKTFFNGELRNEGIQQKKVSLQLMYKEQVIDQVDRWYAGSTNKNEKPRHYSTMARKKPTVAGNNPSNWCTASGSHYNWQDENKPYDTGTPGTQNTCAEE